MSLHKIYCYITDVTGKDCTGASILTINPQIMYLQVNCEEVVVVVVVVFFFEITVLFS